MFKNKEASKEWFFKTSLTYEFTFTLHPESNLPLKRQYTTFCVNILLVFVLMRDVISMQTSEKTLKGTTYILTTPLS